MPSHKRNSAIDVHIGQRIRVRRSLLGMNRKTLATRARLSSGQLLSYENGACAITMPILKIVATHLNVPADYFFWHIEH